MKKASRRTFIIPVRSTRSFIFLTLTALLTVIITVSGVFANETTAIGNWSDPATWGGTVPANGSAVTLPTGMNVVVDVPFIDVESITVPINAELTFGNRDTTVRSRYILVMGRLTAGTEVQPLTASLTFTFYGDDRNRSDVTHNQHQHGTKGLFGRGSGVVEIHGDTSVMSWTRLNAHAQIGSNQIVLADNTGWQVGDSIVIASTDFDAHQAEMATITAINGTNVTLDRALQNFHFGQTQTFGNRLVENRAEVGLLSRNIVIHGEMGNEATFGAHTMFMEDSTVRMEGVEIYNAGQEGILARYPFHTHLAGDMRGSYFRNSSVHHSFSRGTTIHGTDYLTVQNNVYYDILGHSVFFEDAVEQGNVVENNLVILTRTPSQPLIPSDANTFGPASYWISNPNNIIRNNVAAGSEGTGFWFDLQEAPTGPSSGVAMSPRRLPIGEFSNNVTHSNDMIGMFIEPYFPYEDQPMTGITAYKNRAHGAWVTSNGQLIDNGGWVEIYNSAFLDNGTGVLVAGGGRVFDSIYVGVSDNGASTEMLWNTAERPLYGHRFYDGPAGVENSTFYNYQPTSEYNAAAFGWRHNIGEGRFLGNHVENVQFVNSNEAYFVNSPNRGNLDTDIGYESMAFEDHDGSFGGQPGSVISTGFPLAWDANDTYVPEWNGFIVNNHVGLFRLACNGSTCPTTIIRDDGARAKIGSDGRFNASMERFYTVYRNDSSCNFEISLVHEYGGDSAIFAAPYTCNLTDMQDANTALSAGNSYDDVVNSADGSVYYYDTSANMLYFKLVQPRDSQYEVERFNRYFDYVRVFGSGTNAIVPPPDGEGPQPPAPTPTLDLAPISMTTTVSDNAFVDVPAENSSLSLDMTTLSLVSQPSIGEAIVLDAENGILAYLPDGTNTGETNFTYEVCDTNALCGIGNVLVTIQANEPPPAEDPNPPTNTGGGTVSGDLMQWHRVAVTFDGPNMSENDSSTFRDYRLMVTFSNGGNSYTVPGFYAADGNAADSGATSGNKWRAYFTPDATGTWTYSASFRTGNWIAISLDPNTGTALSFDGATGSFNVAASTAPQSDFRSQGTLRYVGGHHLQFAGSGEYYLKSGADSPENFLGYSEFDGTFDTGGVINNFLHNYSSHINDWRLSDPTWGNDARGKGIIGALNYLSDEGVNSLYFITYNIDGGDGADTWPWADPNVRDMFDVSKLDQWEIVFSHMTERGIQLHFLTQETENDGLLGGNGDLNQIRQLYYREMVARFSHHPALQWNIGEENSNGPQQQRDFAAYIRSFDAYDHPITIHSNYNAAQFLYNGLYGDPNYEATSIQGDASSYNGLAIDFRNNSAAAGRPWAIYGDEQGPQVASNMGNLDELRRDALWGNLMGGGAGVEWYFGYQGDFGDIQSEDFHVAQPLWEDSAHAVNFFQTYLPFEDMNPDNALTSNGWALAKPGDTYAVYLPQGGTASLNIANNNVYDVFWFNPRTGGNLQTSNVTQISGSGSQSLGNPPSESNQDWAVLVRVSSNTGGNTAPTINAIPDRTMQEESNAIISITANDADGDPISFALSAPDFVSLQDNGDGTGSLVVTTPAASSGTYLITVTVSDNNGGAAEESFTLSITTGDPSPPTGISISQMILINADTNQDIFQIGDSATINIADIGTDQLNIRAETSPPVVGSVVFALNGNNFLTENTAPYAMAGDSNGGYGAWTAAIGSYTLTATPYSEANGAGTQGTALTINFTVINDGNTEPPPPENQAPIIAPIPGLTLSVNDSVNVAISVTDPESDPLTITASGVPAFLSFNDNGNGTASITGIASETGSSLITVTASDGTNTSSTSFVIIVNTDAVDDTVEVTEFTLIDATSGNMLQTLQNGDSIDMANLPTEYLAVRAEVSSASVQEVAFDLNTVISRDAGNPFAVDVLAGDVSLAATPYHNGSLTTVNPANYGYDANLAGVIIPGDAIRLFPGDDIQAAVNNNPNGTAFVLSAGIYRQQQITPKDGNRFYGEAGAILSGARLLTDFVQEGNLRVATNQTQQGATRGECLDTAPRCQHPEDLYFDSVPLRHVGSLNEVTSGTWFFDYNNDRIYFADNPAGHVVETGISEYAFGGTASNVLISNLTIEKYASPAQTAAINAVNTNAWVIQNNIVTLNHGGGIQVGNNMHVLNNYVVDNGHIGISGIGNNIIVEWNDIARNNYAGYKPGWEAGGTKFVLTNNLMVRHNYVYDNYGPGLWTDIDNINSTYDSNLVINNAGIGIFHEISYDVTISNNVAMYNAKDDYGWLYGGQIVISSSSNAQVFNNRVVVSEQGGNGITVLQQNRGSGEYGIRRSWNNSVSNNVVVYLGTVGRSGAAADWEESAFFNQGGNSFNGNIYYANNDNFNHWTWQGNIGWADFQSRGQDTEGAAFFGENTSLIPGTPLTIQFSIVDTGEPVPGLPAAPSNLSSIPVSNSEVELTWVDNASNETMFEVERNDVIATPLPLDSEVFFDTNLSAETTYCYRVRAVNDAGVSAWSNDACAMTPRDTPTNNQAPTIQAPGDQINNVGDAVALQLQYDPQGEVLRFTASDLPDGLVIDATSGLISGTTTAGAVYTVTVIAIDPGGLTGETTFTWTVNGSGGITIANSVTAFVLVNADSNQDILTMTNGMQISLNNLPTRNLSIRARVTSGIESVRFALDGNNNFITENEAPYALSGDFSGNYNAWTPGAGSHTLSATPYSGDNAGGAAGRSLSINFTVVTGSGSGSGSGSNPNPVSPPAPNPNPPSTGGNMAVTRFVLVNADNDQDIMVLTNGQSIALNSLPTRQLNIRAEVSGSVESMVITVNGGAIYYELEAPYAIFRDDDGDYRRWQPSQGSYTINATPYTQDYGNGIAGTSRSITISFTNN